LFCFVGWVWLVSDETTFVFVSEFGDVHKDKDWFIQRARVWVAVGLAVAVSETRDFAGKWA